MIVVANRAPLSPDHDLDGSVRLKRTASGVTTALEPIIAGSGGTWIAHSRRNVADRVAVDAPEEASIEQSRYHIRYVRLSDDELRGYYDGFANEGLWPLCHAVHVQPVFRSSDFQMYRRVNERFARAVAEEAGNRNPLVFIQDYHLALAPRLLRRLQASCPIVGFWHIPWPHPRVFATCPWGTQLLDGMLGSDLLGFQTADDATNFLESIAATCDAEVDRARGLVHYEGRWTRVRAYPVGVEWHDAVVRHAPPPDACRARVCHQWGLPADVQLGVGIDRLDYTKGINEKLLAIERVLESHADLRGRFVFIQVAEPSRERLTAYRAARAQVWETVTRINHRFSTKCYRPIILIESHQTAEEVSCFYRAADLCYVGSLHDGMNLVAKEFVRARADERGVLVLSQFAGAAGQLRSALQVNPYAIDDSAQTLVAALTMSRGEQILRMRSMRQVVAASDSWWWANQILGDVAVSDVDEDAASDR